MIFEIFDFSCKNVTHEDLSFQSPGSKQRKTVWSMTKTWSSEKRTHYTKEKMLFKVVLRAIWPAQSKELEE